MFFTKMCSSKGLSEPSMVLDDVSTIEFKTLLHFLIVKSVFVSASPGAI